MSCISVFRCSDECSVGWSPKRAKTKVDFRSVRPSKTTPRILEMVRSHSGHMQATEKKNVVDMSGCHEPSSEVNVSSSAQQLLRLPIVDPPTATLFIS